MQVEDGLSCIAELLYNQDSVSDRMWNFYIALADSFLNGKGVLDEFLHVVSVPFLNFINKSPTQFRDLSVNGYGTCLDIMVQVITKILQVSKDHEDEVKAITGITLIIHLLENLTGIDSYLPGIISIIMTELSTAKVSDYRSMLSQALCMCLWYSPT
jgi:hypothetical protein